MEHLGRWGLWTVGIAALFFLFFLLDHIGASGDGVVQSVFTKLVKRTKKSPVERTFVRYQDGSEMQIPAPMASKLKPGDRLRKAGLSWTYYINEVPYNSLKDVLPLILFGSPVLAFGIWWISTPSRSE